jgi:hypothetical protein
LDLVAFANSIVPEGIKLCKVRYFTSLIKGDVEKHNRQQRYINALKFHNGDSIEIRYGNYQVFDSHCKHCKSKPVICSSCGNVYSKPTEKKTDVNISTSMIVDCVEEKTNCTILISGDSDYEAPLLEIGRLFPSVLRIIAFPPRRRNPALFDKCDDYFDILEDSFKLNQLPNPVVSSATGRKYPKPDKWP